MSTLELKQQIIQTLQQANDIESMQRVQLLMDELKAELYKDMMRPLSIEEYEARIQEGLDSIKAGRVHSAEEVKNRINAIMGR
jgi:predicted transcriptional regulator